MDHHFLCSAVIVIMVLIIYHNALPCGFVFDDVSAIKDNKDLRPSTPLTNLFWNDFWGTPMQKERSHKSYRPLCVLTFRWNYLLGELDPWGYHLVNVVLHGIVSILFFRVCLMFMAVTASFLAALMFTVHPIHTEAVTGVVGRAELLSSIFYLAALLSYASSKTKDSKTNWSRLLLTVLLVTVAMLCKEQGITVIAVCCVYELIISQQMSVLDIFSIIKGLLRGKVKFSPALRHAVLRAVVLVLSTALLMLGRIKVMGAQLPVFTRFDNPAAAAPTPSRQLTYNYLLPINAWLLLCPSYLCCDWTMGTIPLVKSFFDPRNLATVIFYGFLLKLVVFALKRNDRQSKTVIMGLSLLVFPFLPATNLFFPVGFVVAERILYAPSMGWCLLVACGFDAALKAVKRHVQHLLWVFMCFLLLSHSLKTLMRNYDWESEYTIFRAALKVNMKNAKLYNNVGHALENTQRFSEALYYFQTAARVQPDDIGAHINVGRTLNALQDYPGAESAYRTALALLPAVKPGQSYTTRIAPNHLNVFLNLGNLLARNQSRLHEADALYRSAISMRADYVQAYINRGDVLIKLNRTDEAQQQYEKALTYESDNADLHYNLGVVLLEKNQHLKALASFEQALVYEPHHRQTLFNSAVLMQELGEAKYRPEAFRRLHELEEVEPTNEKIYFNLGMLAMDDSQFAQAKIYFDKAIQLKADFRSALFNIALLLNNALQQPLEALPYVKQLLQFYPDHVKGLLLMGDININHRKDFDAAEKNFLAVLENNPHHVQAQHNLCVVYVEKGDLIKAESCLVDTLALAPQEKYIADNLKLVRGRLHQAQQQMKQQKNKDQSSST